MKSDQRDNSNGPGLSRRQFLKGSGVTAAASAFAPMEALVQSAHAEKADVPAFGPGPIKLDLQVNGAKYSTQVEPRVTLLDALRNYVDVTGPKRVCDRGTCGSCTCIVDGKAIYSCTMLAVEAQGKKIETAESLIDDGKLHAVPAAFVKYDAQQCGFCTPGFVMAMKAAFDKNPKATPQEVETALAGNICRCGTYEQMRHAISALCGQRKEG